MVTNASRLAGGPQLGQRLGRPGMHRVLDPDAAVEVEQHVVVDGSRGERAWELASDRSGEIRSGYADSTAVAPVHGSALVADTSRTRAITAGTNIAANQRKADALSQDALLALWRELPGDRETPRRATGSCFSLAPIVK